MIGLLSIACRQKRHAIGEYYTTGVTVSAGNFSQEVQISSSETPLQLTKLSPTVATAPNSTGTATQISCEMVKTQEPFFTPPHTSRPGMTRRAAAFGDGRTSLRKGRNSYRNTNRGRLIAYSRTSLRFIENIGICINHNKWFSFLAVAIFILCVKSQHVPRAFMFCKPANKAHRSKMLRPAHSRSGYYAFIR